MSLGNDCVHYGPRTKSCILHRRCFQGDLVQLGQAKSISECKDYSPKGVKSLPQTAAPFQFPCAHLGQDTGEVVLCDSCKGKVSLKVFECGVYGQCTLKKKTPDKGCCAGEMNQATGHWEPCRHFTPKNEGHAVLLKASEAVPESSPSPKVVRSSLKWAYGLTTVRERRDDLLPATESINSAATTLASSADAAEPVPPALAAAVLAFAR